MCIRDSRGIRYPTTALSLHFETLASISRYLPYGFDAFCDGPSRDLANGRTCYLGIYFRRFIGCYRRMVWSHYGAAYPFEPKVRPNGPLTNTTGTFGRLNLA